MFDEMIPQPAPRPSLRNGNIWIDSAERCTLCGRWLTEGPIDRWPDIFCTRCGKGHRY